MLTGNVQRRHGSLTSGTRANGTMTAIISEVMMVSRLPTTLGMNSAQFCHLKTSKAVSQEDRAAKTFMMRASFLLALDTRCWQLFSQLLISQATFVGEGNFPQLSLLLATNSATFSDKIKKRCHSDRKRGEKTTRY